MNSNSQTPVSGDLTAKKPNGKDDVSSAEPVRRVGETGVSLSTTDSGDAKSKKPNVKAVVSSADPVNRAGQTGVSLATAVSGDPKSKKPNGKAVVSSSDEMMFFKDVKFGPQEGEIRFRLIHFWEARNVHTKVLMGLEMLLIDGQGTVIQGFIPPSRIKIYLPQMIAGSIYKLIYKTFFGHIKLVNEHPLSDSLVLDEVEIASSRRILVHVQTQE
ncbi:hypothetical protein F2Q69_00003449 [Brassica cretica]|uniref:Uncharacterized protein n=1 Tax=Brassica cretica TaxID=69181 RepID=A0A8S9P4P0_BRACR|nr:hypothetical protein F2Q69_00003449 [Brassica cretica]